MPSAREPRAAAGDNCVRPATQWDLWRYTTGLCAGGGRPVRHRVGAPPRNRAAYRKPHRPTLDRSEFAKLCGARALFGYFVTLSVTKNVKFPGKIDDHPE